MPSRANGRAKIISAASSSSTSRPAPTRSSGADVLFVYEGTDVRAQTKSLKVEGDKIELVITWEIQGTFASTKLVGSLKGNDIAGTYESTAAEEPATGKWSVSRS